MRFTGLWTTNKQHAQPFMVLLLLLHAAACHMSEGADLVVVEQLSG
jgi:hypothetical protein